MATSTGLDMPILSRDELVTWTEDDLVPDPVNPQIRWIKSPSSMRMERAILAAVTSYRAGGAILPGAHGYNLPPMLNALEASKMGKEAFDGMIAAATWYGGANMDILVNLDHPDVRAVIVEDEG